MNIPAFLRSLFLLLGAKCVAEQCSKRSTCKRAQLPESLLIYIFSVRLADMDNCKYYLQVHPKIKSKYAIRDAKGRFTKDPKRIIKELRSALSWAVLHTCSSCSFSEQQPLLLLLLCPAPVACFVKRWRELLKQTEHYE